MILEQLMVAGRPERATPGLSRNFHSFYWVRKGSEKRVAFDIGFGTMDS
jgi:hypothetical protein